jgi:putative ABC transport system ATP-binding protein
MTNFDIIHITILEHFSQYLKNLKNHINFKVFINALLFLYFELFFKKNTEITNGILTFNTKKEEMMEILQFKNVEYKDGDKRILHDVNVEISKGDFVSISGDSGGGKTTFMRLCSHLISPSDGNILFYGKDILEFDPVFLRREIAYCFQEPFLFGDKVEENLIFPFLVRNEIFDEARVFHFFETFHIQEDFLKRDVKNLSGGEKQRIALVRSLLFNPQILLLDEVTSALDSNNAKIVEEAVEVFHKEGLTVLWITHDEEQGKRISNKRIFINRGTIEIMEVGN